MLTAVYKIGFWFLLIAVTLFSVMAIPPTAIQMFDWQDKLHHGLAYAALFWLLLNAYGQKYKIGTLAVCLALFSGLIEIAQSYTGYRQAELLDLLANIAGILAAALLYFIQRTLKA